MRHRYLKRGSATRISCRSNKAFQVYKFVVVCCLVVLAGTSSQTARADDYNFVQPLNSASQLIALEHFETPFVACRSLVGLTYSNSPDRYVDGASFDTANGVCNTRLNNGAVGVVTFQSGTGSCPGDDRFDFRLQRCELKPVDQQTHATLLALYLWLCLIGGMSIGFKAGS